MVKRVHHIDFIVRDLDRAAERFAKVLEREPGPRESLESRGVELVRFEVGGTWIILVQPVRGDSPVQELLDRQGEGFYHIAFLVDDAAAEAARLKDAGVDLMNEEPRPGVEGWKLVDVAVEETAGAMIQLAEEA